VTDCAALLVPLSEAADERRYGGKAAGLACLIDAGFPVPDGYAVAAEALASHLDAAGLATAIEAWTRTGAAAAAAELRRGIAATPLPAAIAQAIADISARQLGDKPCAVRSSAVGEDSAAHSFAGQLDSKLPVAPRLEEIGDALRAVWASLWGERSVDYQQRRGTRLARVGVVVQRLVDARLAGVLFTRAPGAVGQQMMLVEFCAGLGERLVSGEATPGHALIDRVDGTVCELAAEAETGAVPTIATLAELAGAAQRIEAFWGRPMDIEWAIDGVGKLWFLQARPITAGAPAGPRMVWSNANIAENFPEPVSPFLYSVVRAGYAAYFRNLGLGFGIDRNRIAAMDDALERLVGIHGGRLYYNLSNIHSVIALAPGGRWLARAFNEFVGAREFPPPRLPAILPGPLARCLELMRIPLRVVWQYGLVRQRVAAFVADVDAYCARTRPAELAAMEPMELAQALRGFLDIRLRRWNGAALGDTAAMVCYALLQRQLRGLTTLPENVHHHLLVGLPDLASHEPVERLWELSRRILADPAAKQLFMGYAPAEVARRMQMAPEFAALRADFGAFVERWGFRSSGELMLTQPSPEEDPGPTIALLASYLSLDGPSPAERLAVQIAERIAATERVARALTPAAWWRALPWSRAGRFRWLLAATQAAIRLRERARFSQARLYVRLRHVALAIGRKLVASGRLPAADDIFLFSWQEAEALLTGYAQFPYDLAGEVQRRRQAAQQLAAMQPPDSFDLAEGEYLPTTATASAGVAVMPSGGDQLMGTGACGGQLTAVARVLANANEGRHLERGEIVVTRQTDPGWASVFFLAGGLVVERGGMLSHGAIIAREFGIPAVVGVAAATERITSGESLAIDGDRGVVRILR